MTFDHIESLGPAMTCHKCGKYAMDGMHRGTDGHWRHPQCCPDCAPRQPLQSGEVRSTEGGEQESLLFQESGGEE